MEPLRIPGLHRGEPVADLSTVQNGEFLPSKNGCGGSRRPGKNKRRESLRGVCMACLPAAYEVSCRIRAGSPTSLWPDSPRTVASRRFGSPVPRRRGLGGKSPLVRRRRESMRTARRVNLLWIAPSRRGWCPGTELNRRHEDFQSSALPTELPGLATRRLDDARRARRVNLHQLWFIPNCPITRDSQLP